MALIKCSECGKEMSDHAKMCPNCGCDNNIMFCPECDKQLSTKASMCPNCGYVFKTNNSNCNTDERGENYNMALASLICSFFVVTSMISLVLGIIVLNSNKGKQNSAKTMGLISVIISGAFMAICFFAFMTYLAN